MLNFISFMNVFMLNIFVYIYFWKGNKLMCFKFLVYVVLFVINGCYFVGWLVYRRNLSIFFGLVR